MKLLSFPNGHSVKVAVFGILVSVAPMATAQIPLNGLILNGSAQLINGSYVQLTNSTSQAGSAFYPTPFTLSANSSFEASFVYNAYAAGTPADGLALVIQNTSMGANFLGTGGSGLGFFTFAPDPAIAVTVDYYNNAYTGAAPDTLAIALPTAVNVAAVRPTPVLYGGGGPAGRRYVWVSYQNSSKLMRVFYANTPTKPPTPTVAAVLSEDLATTLGGQAYFGFTGGTGALESTQYILNFNVVVSSGAAN